MVRSCLHGCEYLPTQLLVPSGRGGLFKPYCSLLMAHKGPQGPKYVLLTGSEIIRDNRLIYMETALHGDKGEKVAIHHGRLDVVHLVVFQRRISEVEFRDNNVVEDSIANEFESLPCSLGVVGIKA